MKSRFRFITYFLPVIFTFLLLANLLFTFMFYVSTLEASLSSASFWIFAMEATFFFALWYFLYIVRYKCDIVELGDKEIKIKKIFGIGKKIILPYTELEFTPSREDVKIGNGQKLLVYHNHKRISELSDISYSNYQTIIDRLEATKKFNPPIKDSYWTRLKQALSF